MPLARGKAPAHFPEFVDNYTFSIIQLFATDCNKNFHIFSSVSFGKTQAFSCIFPIF
jgi:hypothetical protein